MSRENWWNDNDWVKPKYWEKNLSQCHCVYQYCHTDFWDQTQASAVKDQWLTTWIQRHKLISITYNVSVPTSVRTQSNCIMKTIPLGCVGISMFLTRITQTHTCIVFINATESGTYSYHCTLNGTETRWKCQGTTSLCKETNESEETESQQYKEMSLLTNAWELWHSVNDTNIDLILNWILLISEERHIKTDVLWKTGAGTVYLIYWLGYCCLIPDWGKMFFSSPKTRQALGTTWLPIGWVMVFQSLGKELGHKADCSPPRVPRWRTGEAVPPLTHMPSWCALEQLYFMQHSSHVISITYSI
jgi:hypothetical protein